MERPQTTDSPPSAEEQWPPRLTLDVKRILNLLTGDRFYSSKDAALREAILNAVDACTRHEAKATGFEPRIQIVFDDETQSVTIEDNGDGMSRHEVSSLFAMIGASMAQIAEVEAVGEFGIGVISYFLVCDRFTIETLRDESDAIGLEFSIDMLDAATPATERTASRSEVGTTVTLDVRDESLYQLLVDRFSHWCRDVAGLTAIRAPDGVELDQGRSVLPSVDVEIELPEWAESARIGPPTGFSRWSVLDGKATADILYRGVFVQTEEVNGLWGMEGTVSVHPKRLKPRLNREGFIAEDLQRDVQPFLQGAHPAVLREGLATLVEALDDPAASDWSVQRLVSLWLALPRTPPYAKVVDEWDTIFRSKKLFRLLRTEGEQDVSLDEIASLPGPIYLTPDNLGETQDVVRAAVRVLRGRGNSVVQGIRRDSQYMTLASFVGQSTAQLLVGHFASELPEVVQVERVAEQVVKEAVRVHELFSTDPKVALVRLGEDGAPIVQAAGELWVNVDTEAGRAIVREVCRENRGRQSLLVSCHLHAEQHVNALGQFVRQGETSNDRLGLLQREYLRGLAS